MRLAFQRLLVGSIAIIVASLGHVWHIENFALDLRAHTFNQLPASAPQVVLVTISTQDYERLFDAQSPLEPGRVKQIIEAIQRGEPRVVGVDIDTSHPKFKALQELVVQPPTKIVWGRDTAIAAKGSEKHSAKPILGADTDKSVHTALSGLAILVKDDDGTIRRFERMLDTADGRAPSFGWSIVQAYRGRAPEEGYKVAALTGKYNIHYSDTPSRLEFAASKVLDPNFDWKGQIKDRIVLLGGRYDHADKHRTPYGEADGVEIVANVIETELAGRSEPSLSAMQILVIGLLEVFALVLIFERLQFRRALVTASVFVVLLAGFVWIKQWAAVYIYGVFIALSLLGYEILLHVRALGVKALGKSIEEIEEAARSPRRDNSRQ